jgi:hypothetical protein
LRAAAQRLRIDQALSHGPFEHEPAKSMMGLFLLKQHSSQPAERRISFNQSFFDSSQDRFAHPFENDLFRQKRLEQILLGQGIQKYRSILFQRWQKRSIAKVS